eukprot:1449572-Alexandrium_andersonii.AAC.1
MLRRWWERRRGRMTAADGEVAEDFRALAAGQAACVSPATSAWLAERGFGDAGPRPSDACRLLREWRQQRVQSRVQ